MGDEIKQASLTVTVDLGVPPQSTLLQVQREKETRWWWGNHTAQMLRSLFWICPEPAAPQSCSHQQGSAAEHPVALPGREQPNLPRACTRLWHTAGLSVGSGMQPALPSSQRPGAVTREPFPALGHKLWLSGSRNTGLGDPGELWRA